MTTNEVRPTLVPGIALSIGLVASLLPGDQGRAPDPCLLTGFSTDASLVYRSGRDPDAGSARAADAQMTAPSTPSCRPVRPAPARSRSGRGTATPARGRTGRPRSLVGSDRAMGKHQRATPLLRLLARVGWQCDPDLWTVSCRDGHGWRAHLRIQPSAAGVTLASSSAGPWALTPLEAARLRAAVQDASLNSDRPAHSGPGSACPVLDPRNQHRHRHRKRAFPFPPACPARSHSAVGGRGRSHVAVPATPPLEVSHDHRKNKPEPRACSTPVAA